jgi:methyltransferase (TIGR00027 family)
MERGQPSRTALAAATHRALHQVVEGGRIFCDPLALRILGKDAESLQREASTDPSDRRMRIFIALRTRVAEDALEAAVGAGVRQVCVLGAGLDTFAYRASLPPGARVYEVDHPATQAWKRARLAAAGIAVPESLTYAPIDFERETLERGLAAAGFDRGQPAFFTWLGVVPYLTEAAIESTLRFVGSLPAGTQVVFDYAEPPGSLAPDQRAERDARAARVASLGEPWRTYFEPELLHARLRALGFGEIHDLGPREMLERYLPSAAQRSSSYGGHVLRAAKPRG